MNITNNHDATYHDLEPFVDNFHTKTSFSDIFLHTNAGLIMLACLILSIIGIIIAFLLFFFEKDLIIVQGIIIGITALIFCSPAFMTSQIKKDFNNKKN